MEPEATPGSINRTVKPFKKRKSDKISEMYKLTSTIAESSSKKSETLTYARVSRTKTIARMNKTLKPKAKDIRQSGLSQASKGKEREELKGTK